MEEASPSTHPSQHSHPQQSRCMFWLSLLGGLMLALNTLLITFLPNSRTKVEDMERIQIISVCISVYIFTIFLTNSCLLSNFKEMCSMYWLLDNIMLVIVYSLVAMNGFLILFMPAIQFTQILYLITISLATFAYVGDFRVMMLHVGWHKCQVLVVKGSLLLQASSYLAVGIYYMADQLDHISEIKGGAIHAARIKDFIFFYVFGMFTLILELWSQVSRRDGSSNLQYYYSFQQLDDEYVSVHEPEREPDLPKLDSNTKIGTQKKMISSCNL